MVETVALAVAVAIAEAVWAFKVSIGQIEVQVLNVACLSLNDTLHEREVEVNPLLVCYIVLGRVWSQTTVWSHSQWYIKVSLSVTHQWHVLSAILWRSLRPKCMDGLQNEGSHQQADWEAFVLIHIMEITALNTGGRGGQWSDSSASTTNIQYIYVCMHSVTSTAIKCTCTCSGCHSQTMWCLTQNNTQAYGVVWGELKE